jgi:DNA modification methylase
MLIQSDARRIPLVDGCVQCVVTSPPYWGLRDYGLPPSIWGASANCEHEWGDETVKSVSAQQDHAGGVTHPTGTRGEQDGNKGRSFSASQGAFCIQCGGWRGSLGLEPRPSLYVAHLVSIFREVKRVLKDDGVCWLNLGDSFASGKGDCFNPGGGTTSLERHAKLKEANAYKLHRGNKTELYAVGLKPKDLCMIPARVALALQADGWYLRSEIIWAKGVSFRPDFAGSCMPESVKDRPTRSHETVFLLTKSSRYAYDAEAVKEPFADERQGNPGAYKWGYACRPTDSVVSGKGVRGVGGTSHKMQAEGWNRDGEKAGRNLRSVWAINPKPFKEAHFATFPPALVEPMVKAGSKPGDLVLDPFSGAGTVVLVASRLGRRVVGLDLKPEYLDIATARLAKDIPPLLA